MITGALPRNPERVAWTVVLGSFASFVLLIVTVVFGGRWWVLNAAVDQSIQNVPSGTVPVTRPGRPLPEVNLQQIPVGSVIATEADAQASLTFKSANGRFELATVQVFGNTRLRVVQADSPRFSLGVNPHRIVLYLTGGRVSAFVGLATDRPVHIEIYSESGAVTLLADPGSNASVEATFTDTIVTVRSGRAAVTGDDGAISLGPDERAEVTAGQPPQGPFPAERNLIVNGDFADGLNEVWRVEQATPQNPTDNPGTVEVANMGGRATVWFLRMDGVTDWGRLAITQDLNRDVRGYKSLRLHMDVYLTYQNLYNCGQRGTECPLMAKLIYQDIYGNSREWLQGFYYNASTIPGQGSTYCVTCPQKAWEHLAWPFAKWQPYDSDNLLPIFESLASPAATIKSITIYAEGHQFMSHVTNIQLLASE